MENMFEPPTKWPPKMSPPEGLISTWPQAGARVSPSSRMSAMMPSSTSARVLPIGTKPISPMVIMNWAMKASCSSTSWMSDGRTPAIA